MDADKDFRFGLEAARSGRIDAETWLDAGLEWLKGTQHSMAEILKTKRRLTEEDVETIEASLGRADAGKTVTYQPDAAHPSGPNGSLKSTVEADSDQGGRVGEPGEKAGGGPHAFGARYANVRFHVDGGIGRVWKVTDSVLGAGSRDQGAEAGQGQRRRQPDQVRRGGEDHGEARPSQHRADPRPGDVGGVPVLRHEVRAGPHAQGGRAGVPSPRQGSGQDRPGLPGLPRLAGGVPGGLQRDRLRAFEGRDPPGHQGPERHLRRVRRGRRAGLGRSQRRSAGPTATPGRSRGHAPGLLELEAAASPARRSAPPTTCRPSRPPGTTPGSPNGATCSRLGACSTFLLTDHAPFDGHRHDDRHPQGHPVRSAVAPRSLNATIPAAEAILRQGHARRRLRQTATRRSTPWPQEGRHLAQRRGGQGPSRPRVDPGRPLVPQESAGRRGARRAGPHRVARPGDRVVAAESGGE